MSVAFGSLAREAQAQDDVWAKGTTNEFSIKFVTVADPGNPPKTGTKLSFNPGAVPYTFRISKYETSWEQGRKLRAASRLPVTIEPAVTGVPDEDERPCSKVIPIEVLLMANWLNTIRGYHACYNISPDNVLRVWPTNEAWYEGGETNLFRHKDCMYFVPSIHEYFKAAQWDPKSRRWLDYGQGSKSPPIPINGFYGGAVLPNSAVVKQVLDERHPEWNYSRDNGNVLSVTLTTKHGGITGMSYAGYVSGFSRMEHKWIPDRNRAVSSKENVSGSGSNGPLTDDFPISQKNGSGGKARVAEYQTIQVPAEFTILSGGTGYNKSWPYLTNGVATVTSGGDTVTVKVWARKGVVLGLYPLAGRFATESTNTVLNIVQTGGSGATCQVSRYFGVLVPSRFGLITPGKGYSDGVATIKTADQPNIWQKKQPWQGAAPVTCAGGVSPWGIMALDGNVHEYSDSAADGMNDMSKKEHLLFFSSYWNTRPWVSAHPGELKDPIEDITPDDSTYESGFRFGSKTRTRLPKWVGD